MIWTGTRAESPLVDGVFGVGVAAVAVHLSRGHGEKGGHVEIVYRIRGFETPDDKNTSFVVTPVIHTRVAAARDGVQLHSLVLRFDEQRIRAVHKVTEVVAVIAVFF